VCSDEQDRQRQGGGRRVRSESGGGALDLSTIIEDDYLTGNRKMSAARKISASDVVIPRRTTSLLSADGGEVLSFAGEQGAELLELLKVVIEDSIMNSRGSAKVVADLLMYFPAHATQEQVHDFYCVVLGIVDKCLGDNVLKSGGTVAYVNAVGLSGFF